MVYSSLAEKKKRGANYLQGKKFEFSIQKYAVFSWCTAPLLKKKK
jgi:hypothetical protein